MIFRSDGTDLLWYADLKRIFPELERLMKQGAANGVKGLRIIDRTELREMEPNIMRRSLCRSVRSHGGIVCPFGLNIALAENACVNGAEFHFNTE